MITMTEIKNRKQELNAMKLINEQLWDANRKLDHVISTIKELRDYRIMRGEEE